MRSLRLPIQLPIPPYLAGWPRRLLILGCLVLAALDACSPNASQPRHLDVPVLVAARAIGSGHPITAADLATLAWPAELAPASRLSTAGPALGRLAVVPIARGEPITSVRLVGSALTANLAVDEVATAVTISTDVTPFVHAGDCVDLLRAPPDDAGSVTTAPAPPVVALRSVRVLAVLGHPSPVETGNGTELLVAAPRSSVAVLAGLVGARVLAVVGRSP